MDDRDLSADLVERVTGAIAADEPLCLRGGNSKSFYGRRTQGTPLDLGGHRGVVNYQPTELVVTVRSGTPLRELEAVLAESGQMLPFEPPRHTEAATVGGAVASGLSGPGRPWRGAARDLILGCRIINGQGQNLRFGGEVMKNVAGYDVSRLMTGAMGTLGIITEASFKVLPQPRSEITLSLDMPQAEALARFADWRARPLPISAGAWHEGRLCLRLSGSEAGVAQARRELGGDNIDNEFWPRLRDQRLDFFQRPQSTLWRLSLPPATPELLEYPDVLVDWGGAQRWLYSDAPAASVRAVAVQAGGHATRFRASDASDEAFHPLDPLRLQLHRRIKAAFDPHGIFNPGRLYDF